MGLSNFGSYGKQLLRDRDEPCFIVCDRQIMILRSFLMTGLDQFQAQTFYTLQSLSYSKIHDHFSKLKKKGDLIMDYFQVIRFESSLGE